jgi:RHS repeat-associated protein
MNGVTATYDALGRMVETGSGSSYQQFVFRTSGDLLAIYNAGTSTLVKGTVPLPGGDTAIYNASGLSYLRHTDWLGSSRLATTWAHAVYSKTAYAPFGETYNEAGMADRSFTGQDQDVVTGSGGTGAYDFLFRKHDPSAGRWLSPDPYGWGAVDQSNPQTLNRYAYVTNSPLNYVDPNGLVMIPCPDSSPDPTSTEGGYVIYAQACDDGTYPLVAGSSGTVSSKEPKLSSKQPKLSERVWHRPFVAGSLQVELSASLCPEDRVLVVQSLEQKQS